MATGQQQQQCAALLPPELLEMQLSQIDLLVAMYPSNEELVVSDDTRASIERARQTCSGGTDDTSAPSDEPRDGLARDIYLNLKLSVAEQEDAAASAAATVELEIVVPLGFYHSKDSSGGDDEMPDEPPRVRTRMRQPSWANRAEVAAINDGVPADDDVLGAIEYMREAAAQTYTASLLSLSSTATADSTTNGSSGTSHDDAMRLGSSTSFSPTTRGDHERLVRVWFYFPSISTRSKRDDLVRNAPAYGLTGFLLAGKPGLLCLEGGSKAVDEYMRFIKTESWGDIPAHHKKVSERYREESTTAGGAGGEGIVVRRVFADMTEITDTVGGERRGERANRGDMKAIEAWLTDRGLGEAFTKVLI